MPKRRAVNLIALGYLSQSPSDVALQAGLPYETMTEALKLLQSFDPEAARCRHPP